MGRKAEDILRNFEEETGLNPKGTSRTNCLDLARILLGMDEEAKLLTLTARHIQRYAEKRAEDGHTISHGTFYNDPNLNAMQNWAIEKSKQGNNIKDKPKNVRALEDRIRRQEKQIKDLVAQIQYTDSLKYELKESRINETKNYILLTRMLNFLQNKGLDGFVDMYVTTEEIGARICFKEVDAETEDILEQHLSRGIDEQ